MTNDFETLGVAIRHYREADVAIDQMGGVDELAVNLARQRGLRKTGADVRSDFLDRNGLGVVALTAVRQSD